MESPLRNSFNIEGHRMAGARVLWHVNGMKEEQFSRSIVAIVSSLIQFVSGHMYSHEIGRPVKAEIEEQGRFAAEFNTIVIGDGIAMGYDGMPYSLPSRGIIADSVEYMVNAYRVNIMVCISNCGKITPGMPMASMRLNVPTVFVSDGPMEAGELDGRHLGLIDVMIESADTSVNDECIEQVGRHACPGCSCCSGMFTVNSMSYLSEATDLALPGSGMIVATHKSCIQLFRDVAKQIIESTYKYCHDGDDSVLPRNITTYQAFLNAMSLDITMGGSTNTVPHLSIVTQGAGTDFHMEDIDMLFCETPCLCKVTLNTHIYHVQDVNHADGILGIMNGLMKVGLVDGSTRHADGLTLAEAVDKHAIISPSVTEEAVRKYKSASAHRFSIRIGSQESYYKELNMDHAGGCIHDVEHAYSKDGGLITLRGGIALDGCVVKAAGVGKGIWRFSGPTRVFDPQGAACEGILGGEVVSGDVVVITHEGPKGGPEIQEMLYPTSCIRSRHLGKECVLITDGRLSGGMPGLSIGYISPKAVSGGAIGLTRDGDIIEINTLERSIDVRLSDEELAERREAEETCGKKAFTPPIRQHEVSKALRVHREVTSSVDKGGVRVIED